MRVGIYAGSFDPPTKGHADIIARACALCDKLVIGVGAHATKEAGSTRDERIAMLEALARPIAKRKKVRLEVRAFDGLVVDFAKKHKANMVIRGLRSAADYHYERQMAMMNAQMAPKIDTVFLSANAETAMISSTLVRQIASLGGNIALFVPQVVLRLLRKRGRGT